MMFRTEGIIAGKNRDEQPPVPEVLRGYQTLTAMSYECLEFCSGSKPAPLWFDANDGDGGIVGIR